MEEIFGGWFGARVAGGLLVPRDTLVGRWTSRAQAFRALVAGETKHLIVPAGGTSPIALVGGTGEAAVDVAPAEIAVRVERAHPDQVRHDAAWLRRAVAREGLRPVAGNVHWVMTAHGDAEAWMPVTVATTRRSTARRPTCIR